MVFLFETAPGDYSATTEILTFSSTMTTVPVTVNINEDNLLENVEFFFGMLGYNDPADQSQVILDPEVARVSITDNDRE